MILQSKQKIKGIALPTEEPIFRSDTLESRGSLSENKLSFFDFSETIQECESIADLNPLPRPPHSVYLYLSETSR